VSLTGASFLTTTVGLQQFTLPASAVIALGVFYDDRQLAEDDPRSLELVEPNWRTSEFTGRPAVFVLVDEDQRVFSIAPAPAQDGKTIGGGTPFVPGSPFPTENVMVIYSEIRTDVHDDEELAVALELVARELNRDSDHQDRETAAAAASLADLCFKLSHPVSLTIQKT